MFGLETGGFLHLMTVYLMTVPVAMFVSNVTGQSRNQSDTVAKWPWRVLRRDKQRGSSSDTNIATIIPNYGRSCQKVNYAYFVKIEISEVLENS